MPKQVVGYARVSTQRQGQSGLGLEAQEGFIEAYARAHGYALAAIYTEVETGKRDDLKNRPQLRKAIAHARRVKGQLVIAKLDRLARSVYVTAELHRSGVDFIAADNPNANRLTVKILAAVAEDETRRISERTKSALQAAKKRGVRLGKPDNLTAQGRRNGALAISRAFREFASGLAPYILGLRQKGNTLRAIAAELNEQDIPARRGGVWTAAQVKRILQTSENKTD